MYNKEELLSYKAPKWDEWPKINLYMDQVVSLITEKVSLFYPSDKEKCVTSTMINNYIKQKLIPPSKNKKYAPEHLALIYVLFLIKPVLDLRSAGDICEFIMSSTNPAASYDSFCSCIENAIREVFAEKPAGDFAKAQLCESLAYAFAFSLRARCLKSLDEG